MNSLYSNGALQNRLAQLQERILKTKQQSGRANDPILLLAVSKDQSAAIIQQVFDLGIHDFGENYYQEAREKISALQELPINWHFIGPIQSNKTKGIAQYFNWVHSVDRYEIAQKLSHHRSINSPPLNICLQINLNNEPQKKGVTPDQANQLAEKINTLPNIRLRGLMAIPQISQDPESQYQGFNQLAKLMHQLNQELATNRMDTLSMGMSEDLIPAIQAGATIVRIGRALFGERQQKEPK